MVGRWQDVRTKWTGVWAIVRRGAVRDWVSRSGEVYCDFKS
ncbi:MAG: hypothetical protein RL215_2562 [Planctomycetota bacterium]|jgi:hypothetical protein